MIKIITIKEKPIYLHVEIKQLIVKLLNVIY